MERPDADLSPLKRALFSIEKLQDRVRALEAERTQPIAIIGMSCRFPGGGSDPQSYYRALLEERDAIRDAPPVARPGWPAAADATAATLPPAGYLDIDVGGFDAPFFGISPREAMSIDPQQRLVLECAWEALEAAAIDPRSLEGSKSGVFVGLAANDYAQMQLRSDRAAQLLNSHFASGIGHSMASGRISYLLGLHGPSITVDTACSSSLVAVHLACQSLRNQESDLALAAGVNLILAADYTIAFQQSRMLSPDGRCRTFDEDAAGFSRAEGCGVIVLKRLDDAERDGDQILALIRGSAVNQDGPSSGLTAPNGPAQEAVIRAALENAGLSPRDIGYVEAHGTGTTLGDPIEMQALGSVFNEDRAAEDALLVGSVKTNLGHLEAAAGMAGLIKLVQSLRFGEIPAHLHLRSPSRFIPWSDLRVAVPTARTAFPLRGGKRRGGVSSFGFSGTNAHIIVESPPEPGREDGADAVPGVLTLSAADEAALRQTAQRMAEHLDETRARFADSCFTSNVGRAPLAWRLALIASSSSEAKQQLESWLRGEPVPALRATHLSAPDRPPVAFIFTGQGSQYRGMAWRLRTQSAVFARALETCDEILRTELDVPLIEILNPNSPHAELVHRTNYTQPAIFAVQYALTELWRDWGIEPSVIAGHSIGEFAAAHLAGVFRLEDALRLVALRGRQMQAVREEGRMEAVFADEARVQQWVAAAGGAVSIAGINAADQTVVSGAVAAVEAVVQQARAAGITTKPLRTSQAFHSPLMDDVAAAFADAVASVAREPGRGATFVSTLTGAVIPPEDLVHASYWSRQLREPVRFADAARVVASMAGVAIEIGPHPALAGVVAQNGIALPVCASLQRERDDWATLLTAQRDLFLAGAPIDWRAAAPADARRVQLPTYPFQRMPLWVNFGSIGGNGAVLDGHPLLGRALPQPGSTLVFERTLSADTPAFIGEHRVFGRAILPGTAFIEMALEAGRQAFNAPVEIRDLDLVEPMVFDPDTRRRVHCRVERSTVGEHRFSVHSTVEPVIPASEWTFHAAGRVAPAGALPGSADTSAAHAPGSRQISGTEFRRMLDERGYKFGPRLHGVAEISAGRGAVLGRIELPAACAGDAETYIAHPLLLDAGLQVVSCALESAHRTYLPMAIGRVVVGDINAAREVFARVISERNGIVIADLVFHAEDGRTVSAIERATFREIAPSQLGEGDPFLEVQWGAAEADAIELATPSEVDHLLRTSLRSFAERENAAAYDSFIEVLEAESANWILQAFAELGLRLNVGEGLDESTIARDLGITGARRRLFARAFMVLQEEGYLSQEGRAWRVLKQPAPFVPPAPADASNDQPAEQILLRRCAPHLVQGLLGTIDPLELLFPGGDGSLAEEMYFDSPIARMLNGAIADMIEKLLERNSSGRALRILEVGGGTGGTTRRLFERLYANGARPVIEYTFTDVSPMFVERAKRRFREPDGLSFRTFDLDRDIETQGLEPDAFDIVIAANCLHAARDLSHALQRVRRLLRPGGLLLAAEVFAPHRWFDLTVGLTDGWWHFTDTELRSNYACVMPETWSAVLQRAGFAGTIALPIAAAAGTAGHATRNQGLVASFRGHAEPRGNWLLIADDDALTSRVAERLAGSGVSVTRVSAEELALAGDAVARMTTILASNTHWDRVLHFVDSGGARRPDAETLDVRLRHGVGTLLAVVQALAAGAAAAARLCVITRAAQHTTDSDVDVDPLAAGVWGLARAVSLELPELPCVLLDLEAECADADADRIVHWAASMEAEPETAIRAGTRRVPRLEKRAASTGDDALPPEYRIVPSRRGSIDYLEFTAGSRSAPQAGQVEIRVIASSLNFKDVLNILGTYPGDAGLPGSECAGVITRVGEGVPLRVGDEVVAAAGGAHGRHVLANAALVAHKPAGLTFMEAATIAVAYLTAHFSLNHLGGMTAGDRVLIHAAAGGVGYAACVLAQRAGAEIYATAGSEEKRALLRGLGIRHVFDSRSLSFADDVLAATEGRGVTMVLNSLADDFVEHSFRVLADNGCFLEIGKRGIWTPAQVAALGRNIRYHIIDWGETASADPALMQRLFQEIIAGVESGALRPLPVTAFQLADIRAALRYMAQGRHTGKIVLRHPMLHTEAPLAFRNDATYLITGGTSGLGLATAQWAAGRGAKTLLLIARSEPAQDAARALAELTQGGVAVHVWRADVGDAAQIRSVVERASRELPPLRGVIHAAGALADRTIRNMTWEDLETAMRAKVRGTVLLGEAVREQSLDFFVAYSSIAGLLGSPGQANHSVANAFLDAYVARIAPTIDSAMSIAWGPWGETGAAVRTDALKRNRERGLTPLSTAEGLAWLAHAFDRPATFLVGARIDQPQVLAGARHQRLMQSLSAGSRPTASASATSESPHATNGQASAASLTALLAAEPVGARRAFVLSRIRNRVRTVLGLPASYAVEAQRPLGEMGLDSLLAIELRNVLGEDAGERLPATLLFDHPTIDSLTEYLLSVVEPEPAAEAAVEPADRVDASVDPFQSVASMTDDEVERLLAEKLASS